MTQHIPLCIGFVIVAALIGDAYMEAPLGFWPAFRALSGTVFLLICMRRIQK